MTSIDSILNKYVSTANGYKDGVQAAAFIVKDKDGKTLYSRSLGKQNLSDNSPPFTEDSVCWIASMSKLMTSVCAMQIVEKGLIGLDDDVGKVLPELANMDVLHGFDDDGTPQLSKLNTPITLRRMLSHSSGLSYDLFDPEIRKFFNATGRTGSIADDTLDSYVFPLRFRPGEGWIYGVNIDWAGRLIEVLTNTPLEEYMRANLWEPLAMASTTLKLSSHPELADRRAQIAHRDVDGGLVPPQVERANVDRKVMGGGGGIFSTTNDYAKLLASLVANDAKLLKPETRDRLMTPTLTDASRQQLQHTMDVAWHEVVGPEFPPGTPVDHALGGAVNLVDVPGKRRKGSMMWSGLTNPHWWIDAETGIAGVLMVQILEAGDPTVIRMYDELERAVYKELV